MTVPTVLQLESVAVFDVVVGFLNLFRNLVRGMLNIFRLRSETCALTELLFPAQSLVFAEDLSQNSANFLFDGFQHFSHSHKMILVVLHLNLMMM